MIFKIDRAKKAKKKIGRWAVWGVLLCFTCSVILTGFYMSFREKAMSDNMPAILYPDNINFLYDSTFLLYRDLYNLVHQTQADYLEIYPKMEAGYEWLTDKKELLQFIEDHRTYEDMGDDMGDDMGNSSDMMKSTEWGKAEYAFVAKEQVLLKSSETAQYVYEDLVSLSAYFTNLENCFSVLNSQYDYLIRDDDSGMYVTNMTKASMELLDSGDRPYFLLTYHFDDAGNATVTDAFFDAGEGPELTHLLSANANTAIKNNVLYGFFLPEYVEYLTNYGTIEPPRNCTVTYYVPGYRSSTLAECLEYPSYGSSGYVGSNVYRYSVQIVFRCGEECYEVLFYLCHGILLLGLLLPILKGTKPYEESMICRLPIEGLILGYLAVSSALYHLLFRVISRLIAGADVIPRLFSLGGNAYDPVAEILYYSLNFMILTAGMFYFWYAGICLRAVPAKGIQGYLRERSLIYRFFPFLKSKLTGWYHALASIDLTRDACRIIRKIVLYNGLLLCFFCVIWIGGWVGVAIYSLVLYFALKKYVGDIQEKYRVLLNATGAIAEGNLNVEIPEDLGVFEPFKPEIAKIQRGFKKAVEEEVKSQRMKAELITNVSHDLKTPLTAIITYVDLLKEEGITEEQRKNYIDVLEKKSLRLKILIEDLFEVSKANSKTVTLNLTDVDLMSLIRQVAFEMSEKLKDADLDLRMNLTEEKLLLSLDSQKTYRVFENLFVNVAKYAMKGTRVYVNGFRIDDTVVVTMKNISAQEINADAGDLTERFVRGDASRNTEGSGLGLAIAKSFIELMGGTLELSVDGDLFKVTITFRMLLPPALPPAL